MEIMKSICVIGAGVSGLSTAVNIQESIPNVTVTIVADTFSPHTTSDGAAGIIELHCLQDTPLHLAKKWCTETFSHCLKIYQTEEAAAAGISMISGYQIFKNDGQEVPFKDLVLNFRWLDDKEIQTLFSTFKGVRAGFFTTLMCECRMYLPYLMNKFKSKGGTIQKRKVYSISELADHDVVVNCSGLGSHELVHDKSISPIRGQSIRAMAPWIKHFIVDEASGKDSYLIPGAKNVMCGGTHQIGDWNTDIDENDSKKIWQGCCELEPSLKYAKIEREWTGLRPSRPAVRLEKELMHTKGKPLPVIHNYGHGGAGISLHWGCAKDAAGLVADSIKVHYAPSKL